jgi:DNA-binding response OmpR family regulator
VSSPPVILIVDDDPDFREFVRIVLESHGYRVLEAHNAEAGLALMHAHEPDLILLDAMMSYELAGIGIIRTVRSDPQLASVPLILISAVLSQDEDRFLPADERAMVDRFLSKPVTPDELLAEIAAVLDAHGAPIVSSRAEATRPTSTLPSEKETG